LQTLVQVICTPGSSLRDAIANDRRLHVHWFEVLLERKAGRFPGWTKLRSRAPGRKGSINIQWNGATRETESDRWRFRQLSAAAT
jgi:hypothetical protein